MASKDYSTEYNEDLGWMRYLSHLNSVRGTSWIDSLRIAKYIKEKS
jgi:hypothetical protein